MVDKPDPVQRTIIRKLQRASRRERSLAEPEDIMRKQIQEAIRMVNQDIDNRHKSPLNSGIIEEVDEGSSSSSSSSKTSSDSSSSGSSFNIFGSGSGSNKGTVNNKIEIGDLSSVCLDNPNQIFRIKIYTKMRKKRNFHIQSRKALKHIVQFSKFQLSIMMKVKKNNLFNIQL